MRIKRAVLLSMVILAIGLSLGFHAVTAQDTIDLTPPTLGDFDLASVAEIDPADYPILPTLTDHARQIFEHGQDEGRNPRMFSKVGDSMTASENFLVPFGDGDYVLGDDYQDLESTIQYFLLSGSITAPDTNAFNRRNYATELGFTTPSALDSTWADADDCEPNESPLTCEYRRSNSAFAFIMLGTNDVMFFEAAQFDYLMRLIVLQTIDTGIVPVLYTMPIRPEEPDKSWLYNRVILDIATDYDLPVINLVMALEHLPNYGVDLNDTLHLTIPDAPGTVATFEGDSLESGYTIRNLVTLQTLHQLLIELEILDVEG